MSIISDRLKREKASSEEDLQWSPSEAKYQYEVLQKFQEILAAAGEVDSFIKATKFTASNAVGSTFGEMYAQQMKVKKYIDGMGRYENGKFKPNSKTKIMMSITDTIETPITFGATEVTDDDYMRSVIASGLGNPFAYEQAMFDMNRRAVRLLNKYFPYNTSAYADARNDAALLTRAQTLDADTIDELHRAVLVYMLSQQEGDFDGSKIVTVSGQQMTLRDFCLKEFPIRIMKMLEQQPELKSLAIFRYMTPMEDADGNIELRLQDVGGLSPQQKDEIRDSWTELALYIKDEAHPNAQINPIAKGLFLYCFYKSGFEFSPKSFMHLAPVALKENIVVDNQGTTYVDFLKKVLKGQINFETSKFLEEFIKTHTKSGKFTYKVHRGSAATKLDKLLWAKREKKDIVVTMSELTEADSNQLYITRLDLEKGQQAWVPSILIGNYLFIAKSSFGISNISENGEMWYTRVGQVAPDGSFIPSTEEFVGSAEVVTPEGNTSMTPEALPQATQPTTKTFTKEEITQLANLVVARQIESGEVMAEEAQNIKDYLISTLESSSQDEIEKFIQEAEASMGKLKDDEGNLIC